MNESIQKAKALFAPVPHVQLGFFPTPFYKLDNMSKALGVNLYIKRDDFTGMNLFGGNKIRKLEFLLGDAVAKGCKAVVTYGATQSNHAMETVSACRRCGLEPILYLTAVVKPDKEDVRANLLLDQVMGAEIHLVDIEPGESEDDAEARSFIMGAKHAAELTASGTPCYDVPMGGASHVGSIGFANGFVELAEQMDAMGLTADYVYHATGTGGTMAGLHAGRKLVGSQAEIRSITVSPKNDAYLTKVQNLANQVLADLGSDLRVSRDTDLHMDNSYYLPGYEQPNEKASEAIKMLARLEGLFVDPVYTGKALAGLIDHIRTGKVEPGSNVVFWHTGGATALFAEKSMLGDIF